eukprot:353142-Chlamydomonas_euryale.AAC.1
MGSKGGQGSVGKRMEPATHDSHGCARGWREGLGLRAGSRVGVELAGDGGKKLCAQTISGKGGA